MCTINTSSPGGHSNCALPKVILEDVGNDNLNPSLKLDMNRHVHNKQRETTNLDRSMSPTMESNTNEIKTTPPVNFRTNISATKITMSSCHTG